MRLYQRERHAVDAVDFLLASLSSRHEAAQAVHTRDAMRINDRGTICAISLMPVLRRYVHWAREGQDSECLE